MDEVKAQMLGWRTRTFRNLRLVQHRPTGTADGMWRGFLKNGRANYNRYHPLFMLGKCSRRLGRRPYVIGSAILLYGFLTGYLKRIPQVDDPRAIAYLRRQQIGRLTRRTDDLEMRPGVPRGGGRGEGMGTGVRVADH